MSAVMPRPTIDQPMPTPSDAAPPAPQRATAPPAKVFEVDCELNYQVNGLTDFLFQLHAVDGMDQRVLDESMTVTPQRPLHIYEDPTVGHRFLRLQADTGPLNVRYRARVERTPAARDLSAAESPIAELPDTILHNLMPTRYCESDLLSHAAQKLFGALPPGYARVQAICDWIHENVDYTLGSSNATTTACEVFRNRAGVCRDFSHLAVTFCRALNIPARLVVGYARFEDPPPDFHAIFEAWLGGRWVSFDATRMSPVDDLVRIAMGRDAKDVAFATIFGPATMTSMNPLIDQVK
jgi:transglutaminase-like putative cysteine protease